MENVLTDTVGLMEKSPSMSVPDGKLRAALESIDWADLACGGRGCWRYREGLERLRILVDFLYGTNDMSLP